MPALQPRAPKRPGRVDRRVARTRATLREALLRLILERGWDGTSVLDVCDRADVGRSTFYSHFADKEELLLSGFDELHRMLVAAPPAPGPLGFVRGLLDHVHENKRLWRMLVGKRGGQVVQQRFRDLVLDLTRAGLSSAGIAEARIEATSRFVAGASTELLLWSLDHPRALTAAELWPTIEELAAPVLAQAKAPKPREAAMRASLDDERAHCPFRTSGA